MRFLLGLSQTPWTVGGFVSLRSWRRACNCGVERQRNRAAKHKVVIEGMRTRCQVKLAGRKRCGCVRNRMLAANARWRWSSLGAPRPRLKIHHVMIMNEQLVAVDVMQPDPPPRGQEGVGDVSCPTVRPCSHCQCPSCGSCGRIRGVSAEFSMRDSLK